MRGIMQHQFSSVLLSLILILSPIALLADIRTTGDVSGIVVMEDGEPLPGAELQLTGEGLIQQSATEYSSEKGNFRFLNLKPGSYTLTISLQGFSTRKYEVVVDVGSLRNIRAEMIPSTLAEEVEITDVAPLIDVSSTQISLNYPLETIERIPIRRQFIDFMDLAPGINDRGAYGAGGRREDKYAKGSATSAYRLNGVDVSNLKQGQTWVNPSYDTIQEIQVVGIGTSAEYGNYIGTTVNVVTKSGSNQYHGSASYFFNNDSLQGDNSDGVFELHPPQNDYTNDLAVTLGGPIVKNKLMFFANYGLNSYAVAPFGSEFFNEFQQHQVQGRIDWQVNQNHTISGMFNTDPTTDGNLGLRAGSGPEIAFDEEFRTDTYYGSWNANLSESTFAEVKYAGFRGDYSYTPVAPLDVPSYFDLDVNRRYGSYGFVGGDKNERDAVTAIITHYADDFLNSGHSFKFGAEYEKARSQFDIDTTGGVYMYSFSYYGYSYLNGFTGYNWHQKAELGRTGLFIQDDVQVNEHITLNLGLRYDRPTVHDAVANLDLVTYDYLVPRLGISWDFHGDSRSVAHAHYGRYYDKITTYGLFSYAGSGTQPLTFYTTVVGHPIDPADPTLEEQLVQPENITFVSDLELLPIDPDLSGPYTDVFNVGYEMMLTDDFAISFDYINKRDRDFIILHDRNEHTYEPFQFTSQIGNFTKTLYARTDDLPTDFIISNDPFYKRNHNIAMVTMRKRQGKNLLLEGSLAYQRSTGTIDNTEGPAWGTTTFSFHTNPNFTEDPFYDGVLSFDRTWQFKMLAAYQFPWQINLAADYRLLSGRPWTPLTWSNRIRELNSDTFYLVFLQERGSERRDALNNLNLRLSKVFSIGSIGSQPAQVEAILDVFNVFNDDATEGIYEAIFEAYPVTGGSSFGLPSSLIAPRRVRLGARFTF
jgi:hypothetical protein